MFFDGKVALVTGGASGIGFAIVHNFLQCGVKGVGIVDVSVEDGRKVEQELQRKYPDKVIFIRADVSKLQELEGAFEKITQKFQNLDIVVNNAGIVNEVEWEKTIAVNLEAVIRGTYLAKDKYLPKYMTGDEGIILNTASVLGLFGMDLLPVYTATKHGVIGLGKSLAEQKYFNSCKIRVITICPGVVATPLLGERAVVPDPALFQREIHAVSVVDTSPNFIGKSVAHLIEKAKHGSVWIIENEETPYEVKFPDKSELRKCQKKRNQIIDAARFYFLYLLQELLLHIVIGILFPFRNYFHLQYIFK